MTMKQGTVPLSPPTPGIRRLLSPPSGQGPSIRSGERRHGRGLRCYASWPTRGPRALPGRHRALARPCLARCGSGLRNPRRSCVVPPQRCPGSLNLARPRLLRFRLQSSRVRVLFPRNRSTEQRHRQASALLRGDGPLRAPRALRPGCSPNSARAPRDRARACCRIPHRGSAGSSRSRPRPCPGRCPRNRSSRRSPLPA